MCTVKIGSEITVYKEKNRHFCHFEEELQFLIRRSLTSATARGYRDFIDFILKVLQMTRSKIFEFKRNGSLTVYTIRSIMTRRYNLIPYKLLLK